jgi:hypothetical protein
MCNRAEALRHEGQTKEAAFAKFITGNPDGILLHAVFKQAPNDEMWNGEEPDDDDAMSDPEVDDPGYSKLSQMARDLMAERQKQGKPISFPAAFQICFLKHPELGQMQKSFHRQRVAKAWMPASSTKPQERNNPGTGSAGSQKPALDQYQELMARAEKLSAEGKGNGRSVAQIFSDLYQGKGQSIPGPDDNAKGRDRSSQKYLKFSDQPIWRSLSVG